MRRHFHFFLVSVAVISGIKTALANEALQHHSLDVHFQQYPLCKGAAFNFPSGLSQRLNGTFSTTIVPSKQGVPATYRAALTLKEGWPISYHQEEWAKDLSINWEVPTGVNSEGYKPEDLIRDARACLIFSTVKDGLINLSIVWPDDDLNDPLRYHHDPVSDFIAGEKFIDVETFSYRVSTRQRNSLIFTAMAEQRMIGTGVFSALFGTATYLPNLPFNDSGNPLEIEKVRTTLFSAPMTLISEHRPH